MTGHVVVLGSGSWGITLANLLATGPNPVSIWPPNEEELALLTSKREHPLVLPGIQLHERITVTPDPVLQGKPLHIILAVPSHAIRPVLKSLDFIDIPHPESTIICAAKGIETDTLCRMSEVMNNELPPSWTSRAVILSGPSHAEEVSRGVPTAIVVASASVSTAARAQSLLARERFRVYVSDDVPGVELGGALKNVIAIAAGISDGLGYGDNTKGALLTRGMVEIARLGVALGARTGTFAGLTGMGDLITTCISKHSRNRHVGEELGRGKSLSDILQEMTMVAEGVKTTRAAVALAMKHTVSMPITMQVHRILFEGLDPSRAMRELMMRDPKTEDGVPLKQLMDKENT